MGKKKRKKRNARVPRKGARANGPSSLSVRVIPTRWHGKVKPPGAGAPRPRVLCEAQAARDRAAMLPRPTLDTASDARAFESLNRQVAAQSGCRCCGWDIVDPVQVAFAGRGPITVCGQCFEEVPREMQSRLTWSPKSRR